jgi:hypothetical protein
VNGELQAEFEIKVYIRVLITIDGEIAVGRFAEGLTPNDVRAFFTFDIEMEATLLIRALALQHKIVFSLILLAGHHKPAADQKDFGVLNKTGAVSVRHASGDMPAFQHVMFLLEDVIVPSG